MSTIKYTIQFTRFEATVLVEYNAAGQLLRAELEAGNMQKEQFTFLFQRFPFTLERLQQWTAANIANVVIRRTQEDLSFERFYELYNNKFGKKKKSQTIWEAMNNVERAKAIAFISQYKKHLNTSGQNQKYAETYLNQEPWNN